MQKRSAGRFGPLLVALEQPTHAARATVIAANTSEMLTYHQMPIKMYYPNDGWFEQDPNEILHSILECIEITLDNLVKLDINTEDIISVGIANQRETIIAWNAENGLPLSNAIVWLDTRSNDIIENLSKSDKKILEIIKDISGLPLSTYFSASKLYWLLKYNEKVKSALNLNICKVGTIDSWLIWNLTGGNKGGVHITDVTNASRTMLMNLNTQKWDPFLCNFFKIPINILPKIKSSSEIYGYIFTGSLIGIPISGCLGDQQAALVGQMCLEFGQKKCTFGTGTFLLCNTGTSVIKSKNGLITTVAYKLGPNSPTIYALEGSGIISGIALDWLKTEFGIDENSSFIKNNKFTNDFLKIESELNGKNNILKKLNSKIESTDPDEEGTVYFVPAFNGLFAPYWKNDIRGTLCGISLSTDLSHITTAITRALGFQTRAILEALNKDCGRYTKRLLVDGTLAFSASLMQIQADICGTPIVRPIMPESSALGAAMAAGCAAGIEIWPKICLPPPSDIFYPTTSEDERDLMYSRWNKAIEKGSGWAFSNLLVHKTKNKYDIKKHMIYSSIPVGLFMLSSVLLLHLAKYFKT